MVRSLRLVVVCAGLCVLGAMPAAAEDDCQKVKISCSDAKRQNESYCASERRVQSGMSFDGCMASGERAMKNCLQTGYWVSGRRKLCGLTRQ